MPTPTKGIVTDEAASGVASKNKNNDVGSAMGIELVSAAGFLPPLYSSWYCVFFT